MTKTRAPKEGFFGWKNVILLFILYFTNGGFVYYGFTVIFPAMIHSLEWDRGTASIALSVNALFAGVLYPLLAVLINRIGVKKILIIGMGLLVVGLFLMSTVMSQIWQWIVLWGIIGAIGFTFAGWVPIQIMTMHWFVVKRATAIGIVFTSGAAGGVLSQPFYAWLMTVTNNDWQNGWFWASVSCVIGLAVAFFMIDKPEDVGQHPDGLHPEEAKKIIEAAEGSSKTFQTTEEWTLKEILKTPVLWFIVVVGVTQGLPLFLITAHGILHFTDNELTQMQAASVLSFVIFGSGAARFPSGWLADQIGPRWIIIVSMGAMLLTFLGLWVLKSPGILIPVGLVFGICYGSLMVMLPVIIGNYYGADSIAGINAVLSPILIVFFAIQPWAAGYIFETFGSYDIAFIISAIMLAVGLFFSFLLYPPKKKISSLSPI